MMKAKGNSGSEKAPKPKSVMVFKGIKGLVASGPGMTKKVSQTKIRPEQNPVHIDAGNLKKASGTNKMAAGSPKDMKGSGHKGVMPGARPEGPISRDSMGVVKP